MANLGKPAGITLKDHTRHVEEEVEYILENLTYLATKYRLLTGKDLATELRAAAKYHDWGKAHHQWQNACQLDNVHYKKWRIKNGLPPDEINPVEYRKYEWESDQAGENLRKSGLRHEFASLYFMQKKQVKASSVVRAAIAAHHGKLSFRSKHRWQEDGRRNQFQIEGPFFPYWKQFKRLSTQSKKMDIQQLLIQRFEYAAVRSLLKLADTRASRKEGEGEEADYQFVPFSIKKKYPKPRPVQQAAEEIAEEWMAILRAPTGSGKTYAALLWADRQINELKRADRLVIAMPTRFTSNALSINVAEQIDETGLYHSSAWFNRYGNISDVEARKNAREAHRMARSLATPVSVCTIDHLLISLTGTKENHHGTFYFLANSAVVFDEADFYDPFVQANIVVLLEVLKALKVPVLIMSATVPDSARLLYGIDFPIKLPNNLPPKSIKQLQWLKTSNSEIQEKQVLQQMLDRGVGIIYANTVARALAYYRQLEEEASKRDIPLIVYHSRFTEPSKKDIEGLLIDTLGEKAWKANQGKSVKGIAIMTQIGEMSVNISTPLMLSDLCPWDRLAQRIGRLVRFEEARNGICYVNPTQQNGALYPAPYGEYSRKEKGWVAYQVLLDTQKQLQEQFSIAAEITPDRLEDLVNLLYPTATSIIGHAATNQTNYYELIKDNWLILPDMRVDEDGTQVGEKWSSRYIPPQNTVFIEFQPRFSSYTEFQEFALEKGVSCPLYSIEKELRKKERSKIIEDMVKIGKGEEDVTIYYIHEDDYNPKLGLAFLYESDVDPDSIIPIKNETT